MLGGDPPAARRGVPMDAAFAADLAAWGPFWAAAAGAAATLLGLLFVAVSLRLDLFRRHEVADVRDFAAYTFGGFLAALAVAGLALAPHQRPSTLALPLLGLGLAGLAGAAWVVREWARLNPAGGGPNRRRGWVVVAAAAAPFAGLVAVAFALPGGRGWALAGLAAAEGLLLGTATAGAWLLLTRAGADRGPGR